MRTTTLLSSLAVFAALTSAQQQDQPSHYNHQRQRRWVWGPSIIQDPTSGQDTATLPPIGSNVNQFTTPAQTITTPNSTPTIPSFPPLNSSSVSSAISFGAGKQGAAAAGTTTPASSSAIRRIPFVERKSSSLAAASSQPSPTTSSASTTHATSRMVGHRTTTPPPPAPPTPTTPPPTPQPTTTPAETHRILWHERHESYLSAHSSFGLGSKRDAPPSPTTTPASPRTTTPAEGYGRTTPDPGTALHPPTFSGPPGTMPPGGVPGSYAISHLPSSSSSSMGGTTTPAQAVATAGMLDVLEQAVGEVAGVGSGAVNGVGGMVGLRKREASSPARFQVVVKRRAEHSTSHRRRRRTVSVE
ncbi:hypothetical protein JCM10296v2_001555 [Rhodotorula toruloides]